MAPKPESPIEPFKHAVRNTLRALGGEPELEVTYGTEAPQLKGLKARLPLPGRDLSKAEVAQTRGAADAFALKLAYHDEKMHTQYAPPGSSARAIFEAAELARVESIGANAMRGVAKNLDAALTQRLKQKGYAKARDRSEAPLAEAVGLMMRERLTGRPVPEAGKAVLEAWREHIETKAGTDLEKLFDSIRDQAAYAKVTRRILSDLGMGDKVVFCGFETNPFKYVSRSDCFVLSSEVEGFPNVLIEALACGKPVISTDCSSGPRELLAPATDLHHRAINNYEIGEYGILTPVNDITALAAAMKKMYEDESLRKQFEARAAGRAQQFDVDEIKQYFHVAFSSV